MKKTIYLSILALFLTFCNGYGQPKLEVSGVNTFDWGTVSIKDSPLKTDLVIKNAGNGTLIINDVHPTCGCTTAPVTKKELGPGDTTIVHVSVNLGDASGYFSKNIRIKTNDTSNPDLFYILKANVYRPIEIKPNKYFAFNDLKVNEEATAKIFIKNASKNPVNISVADISPKTKEEGAIFKVNFSGSKTIKPGEEFEVIGIYKSFKLGDISGFLKLKTDNPEMPEITLYTWGKTKESVLFNGN